jgi:tocopherol cyclase
VGHRLLPRSPALYHGKASSRPYFEGWFFKQSSNGQSCAVIPGVFRGKNSGGDIAFIQVLLSRPVQSFFVRYPFDAFSFERKRFSIRIAENSFSLESVSLMVRDIGLKGELKFSGITPLKTTLLAPSIMGPFSYLPSMQCNHGVLSLGHSVSGYISLGGRRFEFDDADGYIEKDWGEAFPKSWIWMQCGDKQSALMCSIAHIPYGAVKFTGMICVLLANGEQYRFATYNGAKLTSVNIKNGIVNVIIKRRDLTLQITAQCCAFGSLKAPTPGGMNRVIKESLDARYQIKFLKKDKEIFAGSYENGGLEISDAEELIRDKHSGRK